INRDRFGLDRIAMASRRPLRHKTALRTDRHNHSVFHLLGLDEPKYLGAEVLRAIRPPNTTAGDWAESQMHGLKPRRAHENLEKRARQRHAVNLAAVEFDGDRLIRRPSFVCGRGRIERRKLIKIGADSRLYGVGEITDNAVFIKAIDLRQ